MKRLFFAVMLLTAAYCTASAQEDKKMKVKQEDVPQAVKTAFQNNFANASDVEWKMKDGKYKAKFDMNGKDHFAELSSSGEVVSSGMEIDKAELPSAVTSVLQKNYANKEVDKAMKVEKGGHSSYMVKLKGEDKKLMFSEDGKMMMNKMK